MVSSIISTGLMAGPIGAIAAALTSNHKSKFVNVSNITTSAIATIIIIVLIVLFIWILLVVAVYRLTDSGLHAILFFFFGQLYLTIIILYYGFTNHKFCKVAV